MPGACRSECGWRNACKEARIKWGGGQTISGAITWLVVRCGAGARLPSTLRCVMRVSVPTPAGLLVTMHTACVGYLL
jgi:hypothetical protein